MPLSYQLKFRAKLNIFKLLKNSVLYEILSLSFTEKSQSSTEDKMFVNGNYKTYLLVIRTLIVCVCVCVQNFSYQFLSKKVVTLLLIRSKMLSVFAFSNFLPVIFS